MLDHDLKAENSVAVDFHCYSFCKLQYVVDFSQMIGPEANDHTGVKRIHDQKVLDALVTANNFRLKSAKI
jgi:hypothetical protein